MTSEKLILPDCLYQKNPAVTLSTYKNQESIYQQGEFVNDVLIIQRGYVKLHRLTNQGRQVTLSILGNNAIFGAFENKKNTANEFASAQGNMQLYRINLAYFDALLASDSSFCQFVVRTVSRQQDALQNRLFFIMNRKVESRLAAVLCDLAINASERCVHGGEIDLAVTQQDIADMVGASRQVISTLLNRLRDKDIVHYSREGICLLDMPTLTLMAES